MVGSKTAQPALRGTGAATHHLHIPQGQPACLQPPILRKARWRTAACPFAGMQLSQDIMAGIHAIHPASPEAHLPPRIPSPLADAHKDADLDPMPFRPGPYQISMGLRLIDPMSWFHIDKEYDVTLDLRDHLYAEHPELCLIDTGDPEVHAAAEEFALMAADHLPRQYPHWFRREGDVLHNLRRNESCVFREGMANPLEAVTRHIQEDIYIMTTDGVQTYLSAVAASNTQLVHWPEKLGRNLAGVHAPVHQFDQIAQPMLKTFNRGLKAGKPMERFNWALSDDFALFQSASEAGVPSTDFVYRELDPRRLGTGMTPENAGQRVNMRCERQTITRLPKSNAIIFTVRTFIRSLDQLFHGDEPLPRADMVSVATRLCSAVEHWPAEKKREYAVNIYATVQAYLGGLLDKHSPGSGIVPAAV